MILFKEAQLILKNQAEKANRDQHEEVELEHALTKVISENILARESNPAFDNSAMDGFAINTTFAKNCFEQGQRSFQVQGLMAAGDQSKIHHENLYVIEIMTGAEIPAPTLDAVLRVEDVQVIKNSDGSKNILLSEVPVPGANIRRIGEDCKKNDLLIKAGTQLTEHHLLILAGQGQTKVKVKKQIKCGVLSTGKELVPYQQQELSSGQIRNSTALYLQNILKRNSAEVEVYGICPDDPHIFCQKVTTIFDEGAEILISTGAVSMGLFDFVKPALERLGAVIHFHKCAIRPGKPILFASLNYKGRQRFIFGVPGNPVSTVVGFNFFILPFLNSLMGLPSKTPITAKLESDTKKPEGLRCFFKARLSLHGGAASVESLKEQASFKVSPLAEANSWVVLPEQGHLIKKNTEVDVYQW